MARNKYPEETIKQILDVSYKLFIEKGYEKTTIQDIINNIGMSKGAIYHHFKSKEEIMNAISKRSFQESNYIGRINKYTNLTALEKIRKLLIMSISDKNKQIEDKMSLSLIKNPRMLARHLEDNMAYVAPIIAELIEEGVEDGSITTDNPKAASEVITLLFNFWVSPAIIPCTKIDYMDKILFLKSLLGKSGFDLIDDDFINASEEYYTSVFE